MERLNAFEAEEKLWKQRWHRYHHPPRDFARGYRPVGGFVADFTVVWHKGRMHCFHNELRLGEDTGSEPGHLMYFYHASTPDLIKWQVHDPVMLVRPGTWEGAHVTAPNILQHDGRFIMAYTGLNQAGSQNMGLAFSDDLFNWQRWPGNPLNLPADSDWAHWRADDVASCRDAHLNYWDGRFWMNYTAITRQGATCVALAGSDDLQEWIDHGPILIGKDRFEGDWPWLWFLESSALIRHNDRWLLFAVDYHAVNYWESDRMDQFDYAQKHTLWDGIGPTELVWRDGPKWLLMGCHWEEDSYGHGANVMRFGEIDFSQKDAQANMITDEKVIRCWRDRIGTALS